MDIPEIAVQDTSLPTFSVHELQLDQSEAGILPLVNNFLATPILPDKQFSKIYNIAINRQLT